MIFELSKYRQIIHDGIKDWSKICRKTDLCFLKWHVKFDKFSPEHSKVSKLGLWWVPFIQSRKHEFKNYRGVTCHDNEEWCKIWKEIELSVQNWDNEFDEFWPEHSKMPKMCTLIGFFGPKHMIFEPIK